MQSSFTRTTVYSDGMNILSLLMILASCIYFYLGFSLLTSIRKKAGIHRLFLCMIISLLAMAVSCALAYSVAAEANHIFWFRWTITFLLIYMALATHFCISLTGLVRLKPLPVFLLYAPTPVFLLKLWTAFPYMKEFVRIDSIWRLSPHPVDAWFYSLSFYMAGYTVLSLIFLLIWMRRAATVKKKRQAKILFITLAVTFAAAMTEGFIVPSLTGYYSFALGPIAIAVWITGILYCFVRYKIMNPSIALVGAELSNNIDEMIILFGPDSSVLFVNNTARDLLGLAEKDTSRKTMQDLVRDTDSLMRELSPFLTQADSRSIACHVTLRGNEGVEISADSRFSIIKDQFNDTAGILFIGKEIASVQKLQSLYTLTAREIQVIQHVYQGSSNKEIAAALGIAERTVKNHLMNIFNKLAINSKIQLITLLEEYHVVPEKKAHKKLLLFTEKPVR